MGSNAATLTSWFSNPEICEAHPERNPSPVLKRSACLVVLEKRIVGGGDEKTQTVWPSSVVYLTEEQVCMSTVRRAKNCEKTYTHQQQGKGEIEKMYTCHTQSTGKLIDYLTTDRGCWCPFGERDSRKGETGTLADSSQSFCSVKCTAKNCTSVYHRSLIFRVMDHGRHARAIFLHVGFYTRHTIKW